MRVIKINKNILLSVFWILIGTTRLYSVFDYIIYSSKRLLLFTPSIEVLAKDIVFGGIYCLFGILILKKSKSLVNNIVVFLCSTVFYSVFWIVFSIIRIGDLELEYLFIIDYLLIILLVASVKILKGNAFSSDMKFNIFEIKTVIPIVFLNIIIWGISELLRW